MNDRTPHWISWARLVRLPNVFTALADIALGALVANALDAVAIGFSAAASAFLYSAGMVWNDLFDIGQDARERPFRPLPSGEVSPGSALVLALSLTLAGCAAALGTGPLSFGIACLLTLAILLYDRFLKRTVAGPLAMGACRSLNVLLGLSTAGVSDGNGLLWLHLAVIVGLYVVGVTAFARREVAVSGRSGLRLALWIGFAALVLAVPLPLHKPEGTASPLFPYLLVAFGWLIGMPALRAIAKPAPELVQAAVKRAVLGIIGLDAVLATAVRGMEGLLILLLLPPALLLGRRVYST